LSASPPKRFVNLMEALKEALAKTHGGSQETTAKRREPRERRAK